MQSESIIVFQVYLIGIRRDVILPTFAGQISASAAAL